MKKRYLLPLAAVAVGLSLFLFYSFYHQAQEEAVRNLHDGQLLHASHAARGVEDFFNHWTILLTALSESTPILQMDEAAKRTVEFLYNANRDKIKAITRVDAAGRIVHTFPFNPDAIGRDVSQQGHVREVMRTHKTVISDVFRAVQGYDTIALHVPVFGAGVYRGTIAVTIDFQALSKRYIEEIKMGKTGYAWMVSREGIELFCPVPGHTGKSVFENNRDFPTLLAMAREMLEGRQGTAVYTDDHMREVKTSPIKKHAVFMPIKIGNTFWSVVVCSAEDEIIATLENFRNRLLLVVGLLLLVGVLFSYYGLKARLIMREEKRRHRAEAALRESEERYRALVDHASDIIFRVDTTGHLTFVNPAGLRIVGCGEKELIGRHYTTLVRPDMREESFKFFGRQLVERIENTYSEYPVDVKGGREVWLGQNTQLVFKEGKVVAFQAVARDITERKRAEEELRRNQTVAERLAQELAIIAETGKVIGSTLDTEEVYERFAAEVGKLIPFDRLSVNLHDLDRGLVMPVYVSGERVAGREQGDTFPLAGSVSELLVRTRAGIFAHPSSIEEMDQRFPDHTATMKAGMRSLLSVPLISRDSVIASLHFRSRKPDAYSEQDLRLAERIGEQIAGAIANARLYDNLKRTERELKASERRYRELSIVDDLTQLYNSRHFYFQLKIELDRSNRYEQPLTLLLLDIDNFKRFNDAYGHVEGDEVLRRLGQVVKRCLRETDLAYRYGGEEFTIVLPMTTRAEGAVTAERIRMEFKKESFFPAAGQGVHATVSIGLAQYRPQEEMKAFVHRVDQLMYRGKRSGKDRVCCEPSDQEPFERQSSIFFDS